MRRPRRAGKHVTVYVDDGELMKHAPSVRALLRRRGVAPGDIDDVVQETMIGAWCGVQAGQFRVAREQPLARAVKAWLRGIALRQASRARARARRRNEVLSADPEAVCGARVPRPPAEERIAAREALRAFGQLRPELAEVVYRAALGWTVVEIAADLGLRYGTAATRLRLARRALRRRGW